MVFQIMSSVFQVFFASHTSSREFISTSKQRSSSPAVQKRIFRCNHMEIKVIGKNDTCFSFYPFSKSLDQTDSSYQKHMLKRIRSRRSSRLHGESSLGMEDLILKQLFEELHQFRIDQYQSLRVETRVQEPGIFQHPFESD